jgi:hypothetical protein
MALILACIAVFVTSLFGTLFWLAIPTTLQVIVDKVIGQNSPGALSVLGVYMLVCVILASASEVLIGVFVQSLDRGELTNRRRLLQVAAVLPRALAIAVVLYLYNSGVTIATVVLTAMSCGANVLGAKLGYLKRSFRHPLPISLWLPLTLVVVFVLWYGAFQVLAGQLLLGQWVAVGVLSLQFAVTLLSFSSTLPPDNCIGH